MICSNCPSGFGPDNPEPRRSDSGADHFNLLNSERHRLRRRLVHLRDPAHRVLLQRVVPHGQPEGETQDRPGLLGDAVALRRGECLDELVDLAHVDLAQGVVLKRRHHELGACSARRARGCWERACPPGPGRRARPRPVARTNCRPIAPLARWSSSHGGSASPSMPVQRTCGSRRSPARAGELAVVVTETDPSLHLPVGGVDEGDVTERPDRDAGSSHLRSPPVGVLAGP